MIDLAHRIIIEHDLILRKSNRIYRNIMTRLKLNLLLQLQKIYNEQLILM